METVIPLPFRDFPEDVQLSVLSFLGPSDLAAFASTCKRFVSLFRHDQRVWFSMCHRRWGSKTLINKWGGGRISYKRLYSILDEYENLIGFWRRCGESAAAATASSPPPLVFFEWGPFYITGSRVSPSKNRGYEIIKNPFLWMSVASNGEAVNYLDPDGRSALTEEDLIGELGSVDNELIQVNVSFIGECHVVVEENSGFSWLGRGSSSGNLRSEELENVCGSPPDKLMTEIYQYFANRTSPSGNGVSRRQRRREKVKHGKTRKWEPEHFVKIVNCSPKPARPLQGLWKGICDDMSLDFYLVSYDDIGGIACRKVGDSNRPLNYQAPIFWASNLKFIESPFSLEEDYIYNCRLHLMPGVEKDQSSNNLSCSDNGSVSRMLYINSSNGLVPGLAGTTLNPQLVDGRIWQYGDGTFGFGFLRDDYIIDLKHIARNGHLLDTIEPSDG